MTRADLDKFGRDYGRPRGQYALVALVESAPRPYAYDPDT